MSYLYFQHLSPRSYCASPPSHTSRTSVIVLTDIGKFEENQTQKYFVIIIKQTKCNLHKSNRRLLFYVKTPHLWLLGSNQRPELQIGPFLFSEVVRINLECWYHITAKQNSPNIGQALSARCMICALQSPMS